MKSLREQLAEIKVALSSPSKVKSAHDVGYKVASLKIKKRRKMCKLCGVKVNVDRLIEHNSKFHKLRKKPKQPGGKLSLKPLLPQAEQESAVIGEVTKPIQKKPSRKLPFIKQHSNKSENKSGSANRLTIKPYDWASLAPQKVELINIFYKTVMTGQIGFIKKLSVLEKEAGLKVASRRLRKHLKLNVDVIRAGQLSVDQKQHFKILRENWKSLRDEQAVFSSLFDVAYPLKKSDSFNSSNNDSSKTPFKGVSSLVQNSEIRNYLIRVPEKEQIGKFGVPQDEYRHGFYGSGSMEYDVWRKGEK